MTKFSMILGALCLSTAALADEPAKADAAPAAAAAPAPAPAKKARTAPESIVASDLKWADTPMKGVQSVTLWGDPEKGAHGRFIKFAGGTDNALHTHSSTLHSVVVSGTFYTGADMASAKDLGPGSYATTPSGWKHVSGCRAGADCVIMSESGGKFDFKPVGAKPAEAKPAEPKKE
jgi:quercetin dioxygenase-like cupin family protein